MRRGVSNQTSALFSLPCRHVRPIPIDPQTARALEVDVWLISCEPLRAINFYTELLSPEERERAERFHRELDRSRFRVTHAAMRTILARYLNVRPQALSFSADRGMKPELAAPFRDTGIQYNLSHSSGLALLAVAKGARVGIDIERINLEFPIVEIAERFFSAAEISALNALPCGEKHEAFFSCWTRKEAYIKALGGGLSVPLDSFEVAFGSQRAAALVAVQDNPAEVSRWTMYDLQVPKGYKAALLVEGKAHKLSQFSWAWDPQ